MRRGTQIFVFKNKTIEKKKLRKKKRLTALLVRWDSRWSEAGETSLDVAAAAAAAAAEWPGSREGPETEECSADEESLLSTRCRVNQRTRGGGKEIVGRKERRGKQEGGGAGGNDMERGKTKLSKEEKS